MLLEKETEKLNVPHVIQSLNTKKKMFNTVVSIHGEIINSSM